MEQGVLPIKGEQLRLLAKAALEIQEGIFAESAFKGRHDELMIGKSHGRGIPWS
jgi:hypothetical protein